MISRWGGEKKGSQGGRKSARCFFFSKYQAHDSEKKKKKKIIISFPFSSTSKPPPANPLSYINSSFWGGRGVVVARSSNPSVPEATARISCVLDWHVGLPGGLLVRWPPVQMEGRAGQCQLVSRIKTTHLFAEVSRDATGPKQGEGEGGRGVGQRWGRGSSGASERGSSRSLALAPSFPPHHLPLSRPPLLIFLGLPEAITAVYGRQPAGWLLRRRPGDRLPARRWRRRRR